MSRVRIIGGGLTGILAALQAHRLGVRQIDLYERSDQLGGAALPAERDGLEMRESCLYFGPQGDPIRDLLEAYGPTFEDFDNGFGSVSPNGRGEPIYVEDFAGPALPSGGIGASPPAGPSLADRLAAYPSEIARPLAKYARWHLGCDLRNAHESAVFPLAINRVYPVGSNLAALADAKRHDRLTDELYAIPRALWGRTENLTASLPAGGFVALFRRCRLALEAIGVNIHDNCLVSARQALAEHAAGEILIWAADPTPLFKAMNVPTPKLLSKSFASYVFSVHWTGPKPFYVQNFTAEGACFRVYIYETAGRTLLTAECVSEAQNADLRYDVHRLMQGFDGDLALGELLATSVKPRWVYHSLDTIARLAEMRAACAERLGPAFVPGAWEPYSRTEKFAQVNAGLAAALEAKGRAAAAA